MVNTQPISTFLHHITIFSISYGKQSSCVSTWGLYFLIIKSITLKKKYSLLEIATWFLILIGLVLMVTSCAVYNPYKPQKVKQYRCIVGKVDYWQR